MLYCFYNNFQGGTVMIRVAICDDMPDILTQTKQLLEQWGTDKHALHIDTFSNGDDLISAHKRIPYDILILDVVMPLLNGIDTAKELRHFDQTVRIVFLTSTSDFAVESYLVKASNYLLKPIQPNKFFEAMDELYEEIRQKNKSIAVRCASTIYRVELARIEYVEAQNKYVQFYLTDGKILSSVQPLYSYEDSLSLEDCFYRCHRSYIVNLQHVHTFTQKEICLRSGAIVPISRKHSKDFESTYFEVIFGKAGER